MFKKLLLIGLLVPVVVTFTAQAENREISFEDKDSKVASAIGLAAKGTVLWAIPGFWFAREALRSANRFCFGLMMGEENFNEMMRVLDINKNHQDVLINKAVLCVVISAISYYLLKNAKWHFDQIEKLSKKNEDELVFNA